MGKNKNIFRSILKGPSLGYTDNLPTRVLWEEVAKELNGEFKIKHNPGHVIETHTVTIPYKKWEMKISVSDSRPLKFQFSFEASQEFDLILSREDFIDRIMKKLSKADIQIGWKEFDNHYLIKSNRSDLVKKTITKDIQQTMLKHNIYSISYSTDKKARTAEMISVIQRKAGNKEMIFELVEMYKMLIDNLEMARIIN